MIFLQRYLLSSAVVIALNTLFMTTPQASSPVWNFDSVISQSHKSPLSQYYYVAKGEQWDNIIYQARYTLEKASRLSVSLDGRPIYSANLQQNGVIEFQVPRTSSGFHRLDFNFQPEEKNPQNDFCLPDFNTKVALDDTRLSYKILRSEYILKDLPDALYNPQLMSKMPLKAKLVYNPQKVFESSMLSRLLASWASQREVQWLYQEDGSDQADFTIIVEQDHTITNSVLSLALLNNRPTLTIKYKQPQHLEQAINALLNQDYLDQLDLPVAVITEAPSSPHWATLKKFDNLADFGIQDFRLGHEQKVLNLNFPAIWQPTDILEGQIALRVQSGLLEGSAITSWINGTLAGSMKLSELESDPVDRQFNIFSADILESSNFNLTLENTLIANSKCLPTAQGALWVNPQKSLIKLPYKPKQGVIAISAVLATQPIIAVDENIASSSMAVTLMQMTKTMLMHNAPVPLQLTRFDPANPKMVNIRVNPEIYQQQVAMHKNTLYVPAAANGTFIVYENDRFNLITDHQLGAENFNRIWSNIQNQIPANSAKIFISSEGKVYLLKVNNIKNTTQEPSIDQSNIVTWLGSATLVLIILLGGAKIWRRRKNGAKNN
jgi:hypothetical protein